MRLQIRELVVGVNFTELNCIGAVERESTDLGRANGSRGWKILRDLYSFESGVLGVPAVPGSSLSILCMEVRTVDCSIALPPQDSSS